MRFVWGIVGIAIGVFLVWKTYAVGRFFGKSSWAERTFSGGLGGTYFFIKLIGIAIIILSMAAMFGIIDSIFSPSSLTEGFAPQ